jgi:hypothetical protein
METADYLDRRVTLSSAPRRSLPPGLRTLPRSEAYLAVYHAAEAYISSARIGSPKRIAVSEENSAD